MIPHLQPTSRSFSFDLMFSTLKLAIVYLTLGPPAGVFGILYSLLTGKDDILYKSGLMRIARFGVYAAGVRIELRGLENVPAGRPCIFMANHASNLDPPIILPLIPGRTSILLKSSLMRIPILGTAMRMGKFVPIERGGSLEGGRRSVNAATSAIRSGLHLVVFPEGTRSPDGRLATFKKGPFFLAERTGAPIIPVAIVGTQRLMPKDSAAIHPGVVQVTYLPLIEPGDYPTRDALMKAVHSAIAIALPTELKPININLPLSAPMLIQPLPL
jgi:1-acyl-sn-glycerol-3-phosphate acyltransferase